MFLPSAVLFYQKTFISLSSITNPSLKNVSLIILDSLFSFKLKIIPIIVPDGFPLGFWSGSIAIRYAFPIRYAIRSLSESERSNPYLLRKSCGKQSVPMETEGLFDIKIGTEQYRSGMMETWY